MDRRRLAARLWPLRRGKSRFSREAGSAMFQGLRVRLTLWYCGVLAAALVLFGIALYFGTQLSLLKPIEDGAQAHARGHVSGWFSDQIDHTCRLGGPPISQPGGLYPDQGGTFMPDLLVCFSSDGSLLQPQGENITSILPPAFLSNTLAETVLQTGQEKEDTINAGTFKEVAYGTVYRYALPVTNGDGQIVGVVVAGASIQTQEDALSSLLKLLLGIGGLALLGAGIGGLFLSNRALAPARLAWTNQQRFIADAAHELRTPLTLLRADAEVLLRGRRHLSVEDAALLEDIVAEANHMGNLATNLLTLARLDNNTTHREHEVVNLAEIAHAGARRIQALADQSGISVQVETDSKAIVIGDPAMLEQAVLALLDNAIKYNRPGGRITIRTATQDKNALLEVRDTGIGIAAEHLPHLGERFYRVDKARSRAAGGTGLGLSITRGIALAHEGQLKLESAADQGTSVTLLLPLAQNSSLVHDDTESAMPLPGMQQSI